MRLSILIIGGTRYFGIELVHALLARGHRLTLLTRGQRPDPFGAAVRRLRADRSNAESLANALGDQCYDRVYDQVAYTAADAALAAKQFKGRVGRYLMASTLEVYDQLHGQLQRPYAEQDLKLSAADEQGYGGGKRQAERVLLESGLPVATLRLAHVLGGPEDFTGRSAALVRRLRGGQTLRHARAAGPSSFIAVPDLVQALLWAGEQDFEGPLNIGSADLWSLPALHQRLAQVLGLAADGAPCEAQEAVGEDPFDYAAPHALALGRWRALGGHPPSFEASLADWAPRHV